MCTDAANSGLLAVLRVLRDDRMREY